MNLPANSLNLHEVRIQRGNRQIVQSLNLNLPVGQMLGVLGPNGAGKTSLLTACCGELALSGGHICLGQHELHHQRARQLARMRAVLPQQSRLTFNLPIAQIIQMGSYPFPEIDQVVVDRWTDEAIAIADLENHLSKPYDALSGGEQQRVQFARVLLQTWAISHTNGCAYLFLDEPTASLDLKHQSLLLRGVRQLADEGLAAVFVILHDLNLAARWCDRVLLLSENQPPMEGAPGKVMTADVLERVYGIPMRVEPHPLRQGEILILPND